MSDRGIGGDMGAAGSATPHKTSDFLIQLAEAFPRDDMTVGDLVDGLKDRAFGMLLLVLALFCAIPFLYGVPQVVSVPMIVITAQIVMGRHTPWMPESLRRRSFKRAALLNMVRKAKRYVGWVEGFARPRLSWMTRGLPERIFGVFMLICCLSIAVPLPLTNTTPGIGVAIMSIGFIERDGLLVCLGALIGVVWVTFLIVAAASLFIYGFDLIEWLRAQF